MRNKNDGAPAHVNTDRILRYFKKHFAHIQNHIQNSSLIGPEFPDSDKQVFASAHVHHGKSVDICQAVGVGKQPCLHANFSSVGLVVPEIW